MNVLRVDDEGKPMRQTEDHEPEQDRAEHADACPDQDGKPVALDKSKPDQHEPKRRQIMAKRNRQRRN